MTTKAIDKARRIVEIASDKLASDIALLDTRGVCGFADFFVIVSGESERQLDAISDEIAQSLKKDGGMAPLHREGAAASGWMLLDYGDIIVHIFSPTERQYYKLDEMWGAAKSLVRMA
ncbi:MAG: ribosome silencing factor [Dehalococcoidia bacterium]|nr:MAG: ribosome silencing factor [Dehalococcoidia bacterium]